MLAVHDLLIAEHGGSTGLRDRGILESALPRLLELAAYGEPDLPALGGLLRRRHHRQPSLRRRQQADWIYKGKGRVVFSLYEGGLEVIDVVYDPNQGE